MIDPPVYPDTDRIPRFARSASGDVKTPQVPEDITSTRTNQVRVEQFRRPELPDAGALGYAGTG